MPAIKQQPLVIDMGGRDWSAFASEADFNKAVDAPALRFVNAAQSYPGIFTRVSSLDKVVATPPEAPAADSGYYAFVNKQKQEVGVLDTAIYAILYYSDQNKRYNVMISEL